MINKKPPHVYDDDLGILDQLSYRHNYYNFGGSRRMVFYLKGNKLESTHISFNNVGTHWNRDEDDKPYLKVFKKKLKRKLDEETMNFLTETPSRVVEDGRLNDYCFLSLSGHLCSYSMYEETDEKFYLGDWKIPQVVKFGEIPASYYFKSDKLAIHLSHYQNGFCRHSKYNDYGVCDIEKVKDRMSYTFDPIKDVAYRHRDFYSDDKKSHYSPKSQFVYITKAINRDLFFDEDGYLCDLNNYEVMTPEKVERYKKVFLFLT